MCSRSYPKYLSYCHPWWLLDLFLFLVHAYGHIQRKCWNSKRNVVGGVCTYAPKHLTKMMSTIIFLYRSCWRNKKVTLVGIVIYFFVNIHGAMYSSTLLNLDKRVATISISSQDEGQRKTRLIVALMCIPVLTRNTFQIVIVSGCFIYSLSSSFMHMDLQRKYGIITTRNIVEPRTITTKRELFLWLYNSCA